MTARERVLAALNHQNTDFVPYHLDFTKAEYEKVKSYFHDPDFYEKTGCHLLYDQYSGFPTELSDRPGHFRDDFGVVWNRIIDKDIGVVEQPFVCSLNHYQFPEVHLDEAKLRKQYDFLIQNRGDRFTFAGIGFSMFERAWSLCGMENLLMGMLINPEEVEQLLDDICTYNMRIIDIAMEYDFDGFYFGDDWGQQKGLIMGANHWRHFIKPHMAKMYMRVKKHGKYVLQHSCGDIHEIFPDLIEIGLDCYQTFQPEIYNVEAIKREFGEKLTFWGGISTQRLLPFATSEEVKAETHRMIQIMGKDGGYIAAPTHAVPGDVPPENIAAMLEVFQNQK